MARVDDDAAGGPARAPSQPANRTQAGRASRVPRTRVERIGRLGQLFVGLAGDAALEAVRRALLGGGDGNLLATHASVERLRASLSELRGAALKLGQLLSLQGDDLLPPELAEILGALRSRADALPFAQIERVLERELGASWRRRIVELDPEPLAAASIGQVHAAKAADGRDLALKIQYPGVAKSIDSDVANLATLVRVTGLVPPGLDLDALVPELSRALKREADYTREAGETERFAALVADEPGLAVPTVHRDLSTRRVLALERMWALPIEDLRGSEHGDAKRAEAGELLVRLACRELFEFRRIQTDPNFANYLYDAKWNRIVLLDFGSVHAPGARFVRAYRRLVVAAVDGSDAELVEAGREAGLLSGDEGALGHESFVALARLFSEPLREPGPYDFAASDLAQRLREVSLPAYQNGWLPRPPVPVLLLHRKLAGVFLLCAHLRAHVDCHAVYCAHVRG